MNTYGTGIINDSFEHDHDEHDDDRQRDTYFNEAIAIPSDYNVNCKFINQILLTHIFSIHSVGENYGSTLDLDF